MESKDLGRVLIPMVTPFTKEFKIDDHKIFELVNMLIEKDYCDSLIIAGTNGEFYTLTHKERISLFETAKKAVKDRLPLIAGTGTNNTLETIALNEKAGKLGYDAVMILPPYYGNPTQDEIYHHFKQIADSTSLPIILYNIPLFTGVNIKPATTAKLSEMENIVATKEEAGLNPVQSTDTLLSTPDGFTVYSGDDIMTLQILIQGGSGVISGGSHVVGDLMKEKIESFLSGDVQKANQLYLRTYPFFKALVQGERVNPVPITRAALGLAGLEVGDPRPPLKPATESEKEKLGEIMDDLGKLR